MNTIPNSLVHDSNHETSLVDVSKTDTVFWPLIYALVAASPEYRTEIGRESPLLFAEYFRFFPVRPTAFGGGGTLDIPRWLALLDPDDELCSSPSGWTRILIHHLLGVPLETVWTRRKLISRRSSGETIVPPDLRRITLIVHGVHSVEQADQLYETIETLKKFYPWIGVVVVSEPQLLRHLSHLLVIMENLCTLVSFCYYWTTFLAIETRFKGATADTRGKAPGCTVASFINS
ncbi:hypothetical protein B0H13DRAFT_1901055 [Mycena leptocephala]|nr:hypothetical protein B0H13DRAFT_1901055 [Mycena leptocephala]